MRLSRARRSASAVDQRLSGSFSRHRMTVAANSSGHSGRPTMMSGGGSVICFMSMPGTVDALNGTRPKSIS